MLPAYIQNQSLKQKGINGIYFSRMDEKVHLVIAWVF